MKIMWETSPRPVASDRTRSVWVSVLWERWAGPHVVGSGHGYLMEHKPWIRFRAGNR